MEWRFVDCSFVEWRFREWSVVFVDCGVEVCGL